MGEGATGVGEGITGVGRGEDVMTSVGIVSILSFVSINIFLQVIKFVVSKIMLPNIILYV